jgi:hypothetical protein
MPKKPLEILILKIIKETLLLEEVNEEKLLYHIRLMTSAVRSPEGGAFIQSNLKRVVIGILKQIAIIGSPNEASLANLIEIATSEAPEFTSQLVTLAEIDQSADPDLHDILVAAMAHFIDALIYSISEDLANWLIYSSSAKDLNNQMFFIDDNGNVVDYYQDTMRDVTGIRFAYEPHEKIEFMKKFAQVLMEVAHDRFRYCWGRIPELELSEYDAYSLFEQPQFL